MWPAWTITEGFFQHIIFIANSSRTFQAPIQRRQLNHVQQNNILTDIQQHQNRFNQQQFRAVRQQQQPPFITQNQPFNFPQPAPRFTQQLPNQQPAPAFRPNAQPQRQVKSMSLYARYPLINRFIKFFRQNPPNTPAQQPPPRQSQFQRSVHNQVGQVSFTQPQPPQFNQFGQQTFPNNPFVFQEPLNSFNKAPVVAPLVQPQQQQLPLRQAPPNFLPNSPPPSPPVVFPNNQQQLPHHQQLNSFLPPVNFVPKNSFIPEPSRLIQSPQFNSLPVAFPQQPPPPPPQLHQIVQPTVQLNPFVQPSQSLPLEHKAQLFHDTRTEEQRQRDEQYRLKLIEKQEKYVQKYYQKQLQQAQSLHQDFSKQQALIQEKTREKLRPQQSAIVQTNAPRQQGIPPTDLSAFEKSVNSFYQENPTTIVKAPPSPATTSTTISPLTVVPLKKTKSSNKPDLNVVRGEDIQALLQGALNKPSKKKKVEASSSPLTQEELLEHIKKLSLDTQGLGDKNFTTQDLTLADGQKVQIIRTSDPELIRKAKAGNAQIIEQPSGVVPSATTQAPVSIEDLAKSGILPPGLENFEVIKPGENGLQRVKKIPQMKKVTFVYLEEQEDGSLKVQGVRGGADKEVKKSGSEVDSILERIKKGEIQLPANVQTGEKQPIEIPTPAPTTTTRQQTSRTSAGTTAAASSSSSGFPKNHRGSVTANSINRQSTTISPQTVTPVRSNFKFSFTATTAKTTVDNGRSPYSTLPSFGSSANSLFSVTPRIARLSTTTEVPEYATASSVNRIQGIDAQKYVGTTKSQSQSPAPSTISNVFASSAPVSQAQQNSDDMIKILRNAGLFAMAKYLRQSGLDTILNETGPYTIFAPTDKAFKSLLVQLGGPDKAEEKFKNNPRLLSGLLLHHVIPGSFKIDELQDEMTGVSLAGTQLRVNQYQMQDLEWNDVKVTTVNGATIFTNNSDLVIPQGVAHAVDRVMFPLPVGKITTII